MNHSVSSLSAELQPDIHAVAQALIGVSQLFLRRQGNFLPHGAVLTRDGEVHMVAAAPDSPDGLPSATEVLPQLHEGLRHKVRQLSAKALGVCENVTVTPQGRRPTRAIKVLFEHERGLCVALYLPFDKKLFRGYVTGSPFSTPATPEVRAWEH